MHAGKSTLENRTIKSILFLILEVEFVESQKVTGQTDQS